MTTPQFSSLTPSSLFNLDGSVLHEFSPNRNDQASESRHNDLPPNKNIGNVSALVDTLGQQNRRTRGAPGLRIHMRPGRVP